MIHQPLGGVRGQATDIEIEAREIIRMLDRVNKLIADATGQPLEKVKKDTDRNFWMSPAEALDYGIVGKLITHYDELKLDKFYRRVRRVAARLTRPTRPRLTHDKFPLCFLTYNRACFPSHWCYPWRIN
jgi:hypothetical protein